jgi:hypothetical protein
VLPTTIKSTAAERRRESRDTVPAFVVVYRVVTCAKLVRSVLDATDALTVLVTVLSEIGFPSRAIATKFAPHGRWGCLAYRTRRLRDSVPS